MLIQSKYMIKFSKYTKYSFDLTFSTGINKRFYIFRSNISFIFDKFAWVADLNRSKLIQSAKKVLYNWFDFICLVTGLKICFISYKLGDSFVNIPLFLFWFIYTEFYSVASVFKIKYLIAKQSFRQSDYIENDCNIK